MTAPTSPLSASSSKLDLALLIFRIAGALVFLYHGSAILFGVFGGPGIHGFAGFMHTPVFVGFLVGLAQFAGGLALLAGALVRVGALCIMIVMAGAIFLVHLPHGFNLGNNGMEYALTQFLLSFGLFITGGGSYSLAGILPPVLSANFRAAFRGKIIENCRVRETWGDGNLPVLCAT